MLTNLINNVKNFISDIDHTHLKHISEYLSFYGYVENHLDKDNVLSSIRKVQNFFGLKEDGIIGPITLEELYRPRCGCPDFQPMREDISRYMWGRKNLTYYIKSRLHNVHRDDYDAEIEGAMQDVMDNCDMHIERTNSYNNANLIIDTGNSRREGLGTPSNVLAFAYLPTPSSRQILMKFDEAERWQTNPNESGIWLRSVARHEISGHMMGLPHSRDRHSLLFPQYQRSVDKLQPVYDIPELQSRYGKPRPKPDTPSEETIIKIKGNVEDISINGWRINRID